MFETNSHSSILTYPSWLKFFKGSKNLNPDQKIGKFDQSVCRDQTIGSLEDIFCANGEQKALKRVLVTY